MADFPLFHPPEGRRLFQSESLLRRLAQTGGWTSGSRLLEFFGSPATISLTKLLGCSLTIVEPDKKVAESLKERVRVAGLATAVTVNCQALESVNFNNGSFDGIMCLGRIPGPLSKISADWRKWLMPKGRLATTWVMKVGRNPSPESVAWWEKRLSTQLVSPRDNLLAMEGAGFEPELVETVTDAELDEHYRELESLIAKSSGAGVADFKAEIELHRAQAGRSGVTPGIVVGRRKEPGEKPPASRDNG